jgi:hypothetical protein
LPVPRFLNLVHWYAIERSEPLTEEHANHLRQLERQLTGSMTTRRTAPVRAAQPGVRMPDPPSWWIDDEDASASSQMAMTQLGGGAR